VGDSILPDDAPFSLKEVIAEPRLDIIDPHYFKTSDNINLAYYKYTAEEKPAKALIFIHGGGACSHLGYQYLAETLSTQYHTWVYLLDIRGHGYSEGRRGDAPSTKRIWQDLSEFILHVKSDYEGDSLFLGGHSSGAGLVLNYASWKNREDLNGYIFISPKLGYKSKTDRYSYRNDPFASVHLRNILLNKISSGLFNSHRVAVEMSYSPDIKKVEPLIVDTYTCSVVNAITPRSPEKQFRKIDKPFYLAIGEHDELMLPEETVAYAQYVRSEILGDSRAEILPDQNHLGILRVVGTNIGKYLGRGRLK